MPSFAFWNTYRLGAGSSDDKKDLFEGILQQLFDEGVDFITLCEVTSDISMGGFSSDGSLVVRATRKGRQLAYTSIMADLRAGHLEKADVGDFQEVFGKNTHKKGGSNFSRISKRPVVYCGKWGGAEVYIYHANSSAKSSFLVSWVAESLRQDANDNFVLAGDLNCEPTAFMSQIDVCTGVNGYHGHFSCAHGGNTHNAKKGLAKVLDWAIGGPSVANLQVQARNYLGSITDMGLSAANSDHLPIIVSW